MLAFDTTNLHSFNNMLAWLGQIEQHANDDVIKVLVATKMDDEQHRQVSQEQAEQLAREHNLQLYFTSAQSGQGIQEAFESVAKKAVDHQAAS